MLRDLLCHPKEERIVHMEGLGQKRRERSDCNRYEKEPRFRGLSHGYMLIVQSKVGGGFSGCRII